MHTAPATRLNLPRFCEGIQYFSAPWPGSERYALDPVIGPGMTCIADPFEPAVAFQTLLGADALRYLALQITGSKASGHPGGFASSADVYSALVMLGHTSIITEAGHHAPGFYSAMFLDTSLEEVGIRTVRDLRDRYRENEGLLGHLSGAIPGILAPAGPLGQGQHFAMAAALLNRETLFPLTLGDGGMGEPYVLSSMMHFHTCYPDVTNFLPVLIWNGYSQEHHAMVSTLTNEQMADYWKGHGFQEVIIVDAKDFDDRNQPGPYVDSTLFSFHRRLAFASAVLVGLHRAARSALGGRLTAVIMKQLKGAGMHALGARSHSLSPTDTLEKPHIISAMKRRALDPAAWHLVRDNFRRAGGGPAAQTCIVETVPYPPPLPPLPRVEFALGERQSPSTALGALAAAVGAADPAFLVTNADGNEASGMGNINEALRIRHPKADPTYHQDPSGRVYEPISEDACAGLAAGVALFGARSLWLSYESFALNGLPLWQTVTQAMAELRHRTPSTVALFTAGALEQGRNGWTHQRPEIENYLAALMRNGNVFPIFPTDANVIQVAYEWALASFNKGIAIIGSKTPLPVYTTFEQAQRAVAAGAICLQQGPPGGPVVVLAVVGDMILGPVFEAADQLQLAGFTVRIVSVVNPRRLYRPDDIAWDTVAEADGNFLSDNDFNRLFDGLILLGVSGGAGAMLEPVLLRTRAPRRDILTWKRGHTVASTDELLRLNGLAAADIVAAVGRLAADPAAGSTSHRAGTAA